MSDDDQPALVVFDMDRTLLHGRVVIAWAQHAGVEDEVRRIIRERQEGDIDGVESARRIARLWNGQDVDQLRGLVDGIPLNVGARETVAAIKGQEIPVAILTDSYLLAADTVRRRVGADAAIGLVLETEGGTVTGEIALPPDLPSEDAGCAYSYFCKEQGVRTLANKFDAPLERTVMVGDSDPDACAMQVVGIGIAYRALGARIQEHATHTLAEDDLRSVLDILGIMDTTTSST